MLLIVFERCRRSSSRFKPVDGSNDRLSICITVNINTTSIMTSSSSLCWTLLSSLHSSLGVIAPSLTNIYNRGGFVTFELSCRRCLCFLKPQESSRIVPTLYSTDFLVQDAVKSPVNQIIYITCLICEPQIRTLLHRIKRKSRHGFR